MTDSGSPRFSEGEIRRAKRYSAAYGLVSITVMLSPIATVVLYDFPVAYGSHYGMFLISCGVFTSILVALTTLAERQRIDQAEAIAKLWGPTEEDRRRYRR